MSAVCGIVNFTEAPVDRDLLEAMALAGADRGPDESGVWLNGSAGLAYRGLRITSEPKREHQPLHDPGTGLVVVFDGRIDAQTELRQACLAGGHPANSSTNAELVLRAYQVWGESCPRKVLGDYAFAIWDERKRRLFCARDSSGMRPLFYARPGTGSFRFATGANQLLADPGLPRTADLLGIFDLLVDRGSLEPHRTPCASVRRLPAAHSLLVDARGTRVQRYWSLEDDTTLKLSNEDEYVEACSEALQLSLRDRLRGSDPVGISLSGGWDSGALFVLWQWMRSRGEPLPPPWTYTYYYGYPEADERTEVEELLRQWPADGIFNQVPADGALMGLEQHVSQLGLPELSFLWHEVRRRARAARSAGIRMVLTGEGGNYVVQSSLLRTADFLKRGRVGAAHTQLRLWAKELRRPARMFLWPYLLKPVIPILWPNLWERARRLRQALSGRRPILPYLAPALHTALTEWIGAHARDYRLSGDKTSFAVWDKRAQLEQVFQNTFHLSPGADLEGSAQSSPYLDRRVVKIALAALAAENGPGHSRRLIGSILERTAGSGLSGCNAYIDRVMEDGLRANLQANNHLFRAETLVDLGIVDRNRLKTFLEGFVSRHNHGSDELWRLVSMEAWASRWLGNGNSRNESWAPLL